MKYFVYILQSESTGRFYIGQTQNLEKRLEYHKRGYVRSTKNRGPWNLFFHVQVTSRSEAMVLERKLKNFKSNARLKNWILLNM